MLIEKRQEFESVVECLVWIKYTDCVVVGRDWLEAAVPRRGRRNTGNAHTRRIRHPMKTLIRKMNVDARNTRAARRGEYSSGWSIILCI